MLILKLKVGERVRIGEAWLLIQKLEGSEDVYVGIEAPRHINIVREEVLGRATDRKPVPR